MGRHGVGIRDEEYGTDETRRRDETRSGTIGKTERREMGMKQAGYETIRRSWGFLPRVCVRFVMTCFVYMIWLGLGYIRVVERTATNRKDFDMNEVKINEKHFSYESRSWQKQARGGFTITEENDGTFSLSKTGTDTQMAEVNRYGFSSFDEAMGYAKCLTNDAIINAR